MERVYVRPCAGVILHCGQKILMHRRAPTAKYMPGRWSTPGGHIEAGELGTPMAAAIRELCEETGLSPEQIKDVRLKYVKVEIEGERFVPAFDYEAWTDEEHPLGGDGEGEPAWVDEKDILALPLTDKSRIMLEHVLNAAEEGKVYFLYDADKGPEFFPMELRGDMWLDMGARIESDEGKALLPHEMHDPSLGAQRIVGKNWERGYFFRSATIVPREDRLSIVFMFSMVHAAPIVRLAENGRIVRRPWNGWEA